MCANYPSDLTDEQWQLIRQLLPKRRSVVDRRLTAERLSMRFCT